MRRQESVQKTKKTKKRRLLWCCAVVLMCGILAVVGINLMVVQQTKGQICAIEELPEGEWDCILVLGAGVREDGSPSDMLYDRVRVGLELYHGGVSPYLLLSGDDSGPTYDEVGCMEKLALGDGVEADALWLDHEGFSTSESVARAKTEFGVERMVIVTQEYHLYRALYLASRLGIEAIGIPADLRPYRGQFLRDLREYAARVKDVVVTVGE